MLTHHQHHLRITSTASPSSIIMSKSLSGTPGLPRTHCEFLKMPTTPKLNSDDGGDSSPPCCLQSVQSAPTRAPSLGTPLVINRHGLGPVKSGAVVVNQGLKNQVVMHGVICPRVGGVLALDKDKSQAFTGGSNHLIGRCTIPIHPTQRISVKLSNQKDFKEILDTGNELKLPGPKEKGVKEHGFNNLRPK